MQAGTGEQTSAAAAKTFAFSVDGRMTDKGRVIVLSCPRLGFIFSFTSCSFQAGCLVCVISQHAPETSYSAGVHGELQL